MKLIFTAIACIGMNGELGQNNNLLWRIPNDLMHFQEKTLGKVVIMGRKTYDSLPKAGLPGRHIIVLTRHPFDLKTKPGLASAGTTLSEVVSRAEYYAALVGSREVMVAGGGTVYAAFAARVTKLWVTVVEGSASADTWFPLYDYSHLFRPENAIRVDSYKNQDVVGTARGKEGFRQRTLTYSIGLYELEEEKRIRMTLASGTLRINNDLFSMSHIASVSIDAPTRLVVRTNNLSKTYSGSEEEVASCLDLISEAMDRSGDQIDQSSTVRIAPLELDFINEEKVA